VRADALSLRDFQQAFAAALFGNNASSIADLSAQPGFAVYRNTVMKGCIDALQANYPAVARLVGEAWFRAAAARYAANHPPRHPSLLDYGDDFAAFLSDFAPAAELPYLADVARVERAWTEAHAAADAAPLAPAALAALDAARLDGVSLRLHPATRWHCSERHPIHALWTANRHPVDAVEPPQWCAEGVLMTRPFDAVRTTQLSRGGCVFLEACAAHDTVAAAGVAALTAAPALDLAGLIAQLLRAGAFTTIDLTADSGETTA
jgi:hypothetical protein